MRGPARAWSPHWAVWTVVAGSEPRAETWAAKWAIKPAMIVNHPNWGHNSSPSGSAARTAPPPTKRTTITHGSPLSDSRQLAFSHQAIPEQDHASRHEDERQDRSQQGSEAGQGRVGTQEIGPQRGQEGQSEEEAGDREQTQRGKH